MAKITDAQIASAAVSAGFPREEIPTAVAVALAESGGNPLAVNANEPDGSVSRGLWQINSVHSALLQSNDWRDPAGNAKMAFIIWQRAGGKWSPWGAFNNQSFRLYLTRGQAVAGVTGGTLPAGLPNPLDAAGSLAEGMSALSDAFGFLTDRHNWVRLVTVGAGLVLMLILVVAVLKNTAVAKTAKKVGKAVVLKKAPKTAAVAESANGGETT